MKKEFHLSDYISHKSIHHRCFTKAKSFSRSILYSVNTNEKYELQNRSIKLQEEEIAIFECYSNHGYLLITTSFIYSYLKNKDEVFKVRIEDIVYNRNIWEVIQEREKRDCLDGYILKSVETATGLTLPFYVESGIWENIVHQIFTDITWMCAKYKKRM